MFRYNLIRHEVVMRSLAELPRELVGADVWSILEWGCGGDMRPFDEAPMRKIRKLFEQWETDSQVTLRQIASLVRLAGDHGMALEADLIAAGLRLRHCPSTDFNWRDLWVFVAHLGPESNIFAKTRPDEAGWTRQAMMMADLIDVANWLAWSKSKAAQDGSPPPDRIPRPGVKPREVRKGSRVKAVPMQRINEVYRLDERRSVQRERKLSNIFQ